MNCWQVEVEYATVGGKLRRRMLSRPMGYSAARELVLHYERRGVAARMREIREATASMRQAVRPSTGESP